MAASTGFTIPFQKLSSLLRHSALGFSDGVAAGVAAAAMSSGQPFPSPPAKIHQDAPQSFIARHRDPDADQRFLTLLDDLPAGVSVVCTSNCQLKDFESRFQTRFQVFELAPPPAQDVESLIVRIAPEVGQNDARVIANFACGNVPKLSTISRQDQV
jgi:hypothetical protein